MSHKELISKLEAVFKTGVTSRDQANDLLVQCYNVITDLVDQLPDDRTEKQSSSRHLYLAEIARQLNDAGIDRQCLITRIKESAGVSAQNDRETMYRDYWRPVHEALYPDKKRLSKDEIKKVYEAMNNHAANTFGVSAAWPDRFNQGN